MVAMDLESAPSTVRDAGQLLVQNKTERDTHGRLRRDVVRYGLGI